MRFRDSDLPTMVLSAKAPQARIKMVGAFSWTSLDDGAAVSFSVSGSNAIGRHLYRYGVEFVRSICALELTLT